MKSIKIDKKYSLDITNAHGWLFFKSMFMMPALNELRIDSLFCSFLYFNYYYKVGKVQKVYFICG